MSPYRRLRGYAAILLAALLPLAGCEAEEEPPRAFPRDLGSAANAADSSAARPDTPVAAEGAATDAGDGDAIPDTGAPRPDSSGGTDESQTGAASASRGWTVGVLDVPGSDRIATQRALRVGRNDGYDRIVIDLGSDAMPSWHLEYIDTPAHACGSGEEVRLAGDGWLAIRLQPAQVHDDAGNATVRERALRLQLPNLLELRLLCDFEAHVEWVAGVRSPLPYRVLTLRDPTRLVIDIRHPPLR
jgi:hypothetical protein